MPRQTNVQLITHLREQLGFLQRSGEFFDAGFRSEAKRIAVSVATLLNDTNRVKSLLSLTGKKTSIKFLDTSCKPMPTNVAPEYRLCGIRIYKQGKGSGFYSFLDKPIDPVRWIDFNNWWNQRIIKDNRENLFSRKDLILSFRDRDGGAHVDLKLQTNYHAISRENSIGFQFGNGDFNGPAEYGPEYASVRQIGFEVYMSIGSQLGDEIGWETPDIEAAFPTFHLSGFPLGEVEETGEKVVFSFAFQNGETMCFSCSSDALEILLNKLEHLAKKAYLLQMDAGTARQEPHPEIPPFHSHFTQFEVASAEGESELMLFRLSRGGRPPIVMPVGPGFREWLQKSFGDRRDNS